MPTDVSFYQEDPEERRQRVLQALKPQPPPGTAAGQIPTPPTPGSQGLAPTPASTIGDFINKGASTLGGFINKGASTLGDFINRGTPQQADVANLSPDKFTQKIINGLNSDAGYGIGAPNVTVTDFIKGPGFMGPGGYSAGNSETHALWGGPPVQAVPDWRTGEMQWLTKDQMEAGRSPTGMPGIDEVMRNTRMAMTPGGIPVPGINEKVAGAYHDQLGKLAQIQAAQTTAGANRVQNIVLAAKKMQSDETERLSAAGVPPDEVKRRVLKKVRDFVGEDVDVLGQLGYQVAKPGKLGGKEEKDDSNISPENVLLGAATLKTPEEVIQHYAKNKDYLTKDPKALESFIKMVTPAFQSPELMHQKLGGELRDILRRRGIHEFGDFHRYGGGMTGPEGFRVARPGLLGETGQELGRLWSMVTEPLESQESMGEDAQRAANIGQLLLQSLKVHGGGLAPAAGAGQ